jgi:hypothetical protein
MKIEIFGLVMWVVVLSICLNIFINEKGKTKTRIIFAGLVLANILFGIFLLNILFQ